MIIMSFFYPITWALTYHSIYYPIIISIIITHIPYSISILIFLATIRKERAVILCKMTS